MKIIMHDNQPLTKHRKESNVLRQYVGKSPVSRAAQGLQRFCCLSDFRLFNIFASVTARLAALRLDTYAQRREQ